MSFIFLDHHFNPAQCRKVKGQPHSDFNGPGRHMYLLVYLFFKIICIMSEIRKYNSQ